MTPEDLKKIEEYNKYVQRQKMLIYEEERETFFSKLKRRLCCKSKQVDLS
jgi:hypothetical protein